MVRKHAKITAGTFLVSLAVAAFLVLAACSDGGSGSSQETDETTENTEKEDEKTDGNTVTSRKISLSDAPTGYAGLGTSYITSGTKVEVSTKSQLTSAIASGNKVIVITAMIDMSEGMLPDENADSVTWATALDTFVHETNSSYSDYAAWVKAYRTACSKTTEDGDSKSSCKSDLYDDLWGLNKAYGNKIALKIKSGTTLIGKTPDCGIRGGTIQIDGDNIQIRNLTIKDPCDPFPHHEQKNSTTSDGYNAQWDGINIDSHKNIWIDHCTFEDTISLEYVTTGTTDTISEKWQIYDGLCDIKGDSTNITVSNCIFKNHDKTMLIGSSDSDGDNSKRFVTLYGNYFLNCGQRLPMVRNTVVHIFNNYYKTAETPYSSQSCVNARKNAIVYAENNYFDSGCKYSFSAASNDSTPVLHASGNEGANANSTKDISITDGVLFSSLNKYKYTVLSASDAKTSVLANAGAGCTLAD
jgi:pectate lyase